jgi:hypothetical protein
VTYIGPEHILLAMLAQTDCLGRRVLVRWAALGGGAGGAGGGGEVEAGPGGGPGAGGGRHSAKGGEQRPQRFAAPPARPCPLPRPPAAWAPTWTRCARRRRAASRATATPTPPRSAATRTRRARWTSSAATCAPKCARGALTRWVGGGGGAWFVGLGAGRQECAGAESVGRRSGGCLRRRAARGPLPALTPPPRGPAPCPLPVC